METAVRINISSLKQYQSCQRKAYFLNDIKRGPAGAPPRALLTGTTWHKVMEARFNPAKRTGTPDAIVFDSIAEYYRNNEDAALGTIADMKGLMVGYHHWEPPVDWEVKSVESVISAPLPRWKTSGDAPHTLQGIVDMLVKWNGKWWHVQHKTIAKNKSLPAFWQKMERDWHECGYEYMLESSGLDAPYGGTLLITARKLTEKAALASPGDVIQHQFITRPKHVVEKAVDDMFQMCEEWTAKLESCRVTGGPTSFVANLDSCMGLFGNSPCPYRSVCNDGEDIYGPKFVTITDRYDELEGD